MTLSKSLESDRCTVLNWFRFDVQPNQDRCHLMVAAIGHRDYKGIFEYFTM